VAAAAADRLGLPLARAATPGTHPKFVSMITELVRERAGQAAAGQDGQPVPRRALGTLGPAPDACPAGCCVPAQRGRPGAGA
jgi:protoporphyrin/coproporphyrin ferrochelatase